jgi:hypothetical protein
METEKHAMKATIQWVDNSIRWGNSEAVSKTKKQRDVCKPLLGQSLGHQVSESGRRGKGGQKKEIWQEAPSLRWLVFSTPVPDRNSNDSSSADSSKPSGSTSSECSLPASSDAKAKAKGNAKGTKQNAKTKSERGGARKKARRDASESSKQQLLHCARC